MDIVPVEPVPAKGYCPKPMEKLDPETYRAGNGDIYKISSVTHDLMPFQKKFHLSQSGVRASCATWS